MFTALAPLVKMILRPVVIVNVDAVWNTQHVSVLPPPSNVRSPDETASEDVDL
jgi:hypothetical protein